jgi:(p)ppGpp synthase/HD superfamily hydrolase
MTRPAIRCYSPKVGEALAFAAEVHAGQRRKGKDEPYLSHVLAVTALVTHLGGDETQIIAAALHDTVEDHGGAEMAAEIRRRFGPAVEQIVRECSDSIVADGEQRPPWRQRKSEQLHHIATRGAAPASLVEACDKVANLTEIVEDVQAHGPAFLDRFSGGPDGVLWYYEQLGATLLPQAPQLADRFNALLTALQTAAAAAAGPR